MYFRRIEIVPRRKRGPYGILSDRNYTDVQSVEVGRLIQRFERNRTYRRALLKDAYNGYCSAAAGNRDNRCAVSKRKVI